MHKIGIWDVNEQDTPIPLEASWIVASFPQYTPPRAIPVILNWWALRDPMPIRTQERLTSWEQALRTVPTENFWGIISPGGEEIYRTHIAFDDNVNTIWFGESLLGYPLYLMESPGATVDDWMDEMYLRMIRGFYNYFSPLTKVGITWGHSWGNLSVIWDRYYGAPATAFIQQNYDFVILYPYTETLGDWLNRSKPYLDAVEQLFPTQKKIWILTRIWPLSNIQNWQPEAMALEIKNCLDRNIPITLYSWNKPPFMETWDLMLRAIELYDTNMPYYEQQVYGQNLLTGKEGITYGWVAMSETEENLLQNPSFEEETTGWRLFTPAGALPLTVETRLGYTGSSAVMISNVLAYRGGLFQSFLDVPPNTVFRYKTMIKTVDVESLQVMALYRDVSDAEGNWYGGEKGAIVGSQDWMLYEQTFQTPDKVTEVNIFPALVYNRGEIWIDEVSLSVVTPITPTGKGVLPLILIGGVLLFKDRGSKRRG